MKVTVFEKMAVAGALVFHKHNMFILKLVRSTSYNKLKTERCVNRIVYLRLDSLEISVSQSVEPFCSWIKRTSTLDL